METNLFKTRGKIIKIANLKDGNVWLKVLSKNSRPIIFNVYTTQEIMTKNNIGFKDVVIIEGNIVPYVFTTGKTKIKTQKFVATSIEKDKTLGEAVFGTKTQYYDDHYTKIYLSGEVKKVIKKENFSRYIISQENGEIIVNGRIKDDAIHAGDYVEFVCSLSTPTKQFKEKDNKKVDYEDIVILDYARPHIEKSVNKEVSTKDITQYV